MTPLHGARAAVAGAMVTLLAIWVLGVQQAETGWTTNDVVFAVLAFLAVTLLLLGVDIRRKGGNGQ